MLYVLGMEGRRVRERCGDDGGRDDLANSFI